MVELIFCQLGELVLVVVKERWESPSLMAASLTILMSILLVRILVILLVMREEEEEV